MGEAKQFWKQYYSFNCFHEALELAKRLKGMNTSDPLYHPLVTAMHIYYSLPFAESSGSVTVSEKLIPTELRDTHESLRKHRNEIFAHLNAEKGVELPQIGQANQVRMTRHQDRCSFHLFQVFPGPIAMDKIIALCEALSEKMMSQAKKWQTKYRSEVPTLLGEYQLNVTDRSRSIWVPVQPIPGIKS